MRNRSRKLAVLASIAAIGTMVGLAAPAGAGPTVLTGNQNSLGAAGSDTTFWMMSLITPAYNVDNTKNTDLHDYVTEIPPVNVAPFPAGTFVPGDAIDPSFLWDSSTVGLPSDVSPGNTPPDGSSAGITALNADTTGKIDFARSSRGPNAGETPALRFWAYALGARRLRDLPRHARAAAGLTQQQLINIYTCNASGVPIISNWHQISANAANLGDRQVRPTSRIGYSQLLPVEAAQRQHDRQQLQRVPHEHLAPGARRSRRDDREQAERDLRLRLVPVSGPGHGHRGQPPQRCDTRQARHDDEQPSSAECHHGEHDAEPVPRHPVRLQRRSYRPPTRPATRTNSPT